MRVAALAVTPVKGLRIHRPGHIDIDSAGVRGDRAFFLVDPAGNAVNCTTIGELLRYRAEFDESVQVLSLSGLDGSSVSGPVDPGPPVEASFYGIRTVQGRELPFWSTVFTEIAGRPLRLVRGESRGFDVAGVTLLGRGSLDELSSSNAAEPVDGRRFRMNIEIDGAPASAEDGWEGRRLAAGSAVLRVGGPVKRCATTTRDPETGQVDLHTLDMIRTMKGRQETASWGAGFYFGVYAEVITPGRVRVGDRVTLSEQQDDRPT